MAAEFAAVGTVPDSGRCRRHRVRIDGAQGPFLVMSHGFGTDQSAWNKVWPHFADRFRIVRFDLAGAGPNAAATFDPVRYADIEAYADDVLLILEELEIGSCAFVGASVGGMTGVLAAIQQPDLFGQLILLGASPRYLNDGAYVGGFDQPGLDMLYETMSSSYDQWVSGFAPAAVSAPPGSPAVEEFASSLLALRPDIALGTARAIFQSDFRDRLPLLKVPTTVLQTQSDIAVPMTAAEYLRDHIAGATLEVIEARGHFPHLSAPHVVVDALKRHLI